MTEGIKPFPNNQNKEPEKTGWYHVDAVDKRWGEKTKFRAWGNGRWWIPLKDGWLSSNMGIYRWFGPVADVEGPSPSGDNPKKEK